MTEAMPFLQKYDITFLRPPTIKRGVLRKKRGTAVCRPSKNSYLTAALRRAFESDVCFLAVILRKTRQFLNFLGIYLHCRGLFDILNNMNFRAATRTLFSEKGDGIK